MKKLRRISYIFLIIVIAILLIVIYSTISAGNNKDSKNKTLSEVEFLEQKIETLLNQMNNIQTRNYSISVSEISQETKSQESGGSSSSEQSDESSGSETGSSEGSKQEESDQSGNSQTSEQSKKFELEPIGVLTSKEEINWDSIKNEIEMLYTSIPTITLDLYQLNVAQEDILGFNKEFDTLTTVAASEKKEETLASLSRLFEYIPKYLQKATDDEVKKVSVDSKNEMFKAYSKLDSDNWTQIEQNMKQSVEKFSKLLSNTDISSSKQYKINKTYVMLNELLNTVQVKDASVFLIKYKNVLEEINNL